jgi:predicted nucleic acid-binding protein
LSNVKPPAGLPAWDAARREGTAAPSLQMMVQADTSIWIDHFRRSDVRLAEFLDRGDVAMHPFVIGELLLGHVPRIAEMMDDLKALPKVIVASADEILTFISDRKLPESGIGYVDAHLLAAAALTPETLLWTRDKRLLAAAHSLSLAAVIRE